MVTRGELTDVLHFVRVLDSSEPFSLACEKDFDIAWRENVFRLTIRLATMEQGKPAPGADPEVIITTDGEFTDNSTGAISDNRKRLTLDSARPLSKSAGWVCDKQGDAVHTSLADSIDLATPPTA